MKKIIVSAVLTSVFALLIFPAASFAEGTFKTYHTRHSTIWYTDDGDFARLEEAFVKGPGGCSMLHGPDSRYFAERVDALIERVEFLLGMYPADLHVRVALFTDAAGLASEYERLGLGAGLPPVYYRTRSRTLYLSAEHASRRALAMGFARAVTAAHFKAELSSGAMYAIDRYLEEQLENGY